MTNQELNAAIQDVCDREDLAIQGGKCIPYIGWFWRTIDFNAPTHEFGIFPGESDEPRFVGFMGNNKWGYDYTRETTRKEWRKIKRLLEVAVTNPTRKTTKAVWDYIQKLG